MFNTCSALSPLIMWSIVDCPTSVSVMIAHYTVDLIAHVTKSKDHACREQSLRAAVNGLQEQVPATKFVFD